ncbi:MAG: hypothetical protein H0X24_14730 [Ktedonobacterales bacterium]|nr:hypothetical protein [Ktedonobacterales bacterium]
MNRPHVGGLSALLLVIWLVGCSSNATRTTTMSTIPVPGSITWQHQYRAQIDQLARRYIAAMTLNQKIGQLIVQGFSTIGYDDEHLRIMQQIQPGATMWYEFQMPDVATTRTTIAGVQHDATLPLLTISDYETATNADTFQSMYPLRINSTEISARNDPAFAYSAGKGIAQDMRSVGMNTDWAPVVDVQTIGYGPDTSGRSYGSDPQKVAKLAGQVLAGLQDNGIIGTLKHFPGLGAATVDAHAALPIITKSRQEWEQVDLVPYRALINGPNPPGMIMGTDVLYPSIDAHLPSELSPIFMTDILRNELHYDGVVVTDALYMKGITNPTAPYYKGVDQFTAGVMSIQAGCDLLDTSFTLANSLALVARIKEALNDGGLTLARIEQSDLRILRLKIAHGLIPFHPTSTPPQPQFFALGQMRLPERLERSVAPLSAR